MLKRRSKTIAILTTLVFCLTFLGAAFVAPPVAEAAFTPTVSQSNYVPSDGASVGGANQDLGYIKVEVNVADWTAVGGDELLVSYPTRIGQRTTGAGIPGVVGVGTTLANARAQAGLGLGGFGDSGVRIVIPDDPSNALYSNTAPPNTGFEIAVNTYPRLAAKVAAAAAAGVPLDVVGTVPATAITVDLGDFNGFARDGSFFITLDPQGDGISNNGKDKGWFFIHFENMDCSNYAGDVPVTLIPQTGTAFGTTPQPLVVGKVAVSGSTTTAAKSVNKITSRGGVLDTITIFENMRGTIANTFGPPATDAITLTLVTKGYSWNIAPPAPAPAPAVTPMFSFAGNMAFNIPPLAAAGDTLTLTITNKNAAAKASAGAIALGNLWINVDEKVAKVGQDIEVKVSGAGVTEQTIVVGQYVDFVATVIEDTTTELTAGLDDQKIGTFFIEEVAPGTLVANRTILFELPAGVEWNTQAIQNSNYELANNSAITFAAAGATPLDARTLKFTVGNTSAGAQNGAKVKFKNLKVDVSPSFTGDVVMTVKGKAGVEGTAKVATVNPMITMTASAPEVNLGIKEQKVSDVEVVETKADTIAARAGGFDQDMAFYLDAGFRFAKVPKVEVIEGDMVLEVNDVKIQAPANGQNLLIIPIRAASYKTPAKIKVSDIYVTADRNAPVGDVILYAADTASYSPTATVNGLTNAFNTTDRASFQYDTPASVAIAKNVTVPPVETKGAVVGGSGTFVIGSNIYTVNGLTKVMDVAPYIKSGRTFVPYRYLALALGVAEDDIVWDEATKKVTVTKGDNVVEATIGSTTLTVNGQSQVMDVAPEINNGRTMLPARYLAEALGASVGWDPATKTVVFEM